MSWRGRQWRELGADAGADLPSVAWQRVTSDPHMRQLVLSARWPRISVATWLHCCANVRHNGAGRNADPFVVRLVCRNSARR